jgi:hypothetical protein
MQDTAVTPTSQIPNPGLDSDTNEPLGEVAGQEDRDDMAVQAFLQLLNQLQIIFLQDSGLLQTQSSQHPMWDDPIFTQSYIPFSEQVRQSLLCTETRQEIQLRQTLLFLSPS